MLTRGANPNFSEAEINALITDVYGLKGTVKPLVSFDDQNARLDVDGVRYVLKISNLTEDINCLKVQNAVLCHLAERAPSLDVPRVIKTLAGEDIHKHSAGGNTYFVRLLTFLSGDLFADVPRCHDLYYSLGRFMGQVSTALSDFKTDLKYRANEEWSMDETAKIRAKVGAIPDPENRALIERYYQHYTDNILPRLEGFRTATLHHDANGHNLVVRSGTGTELSGLFDFGDVMVGRQINELAVTVGYAMLYADDPLHDMAAIIEGYVSEFTITKEEASVVMELAAMRLVVSITLSSVKMVEYPDSDYIVVSQKPGYEVLRALGKLDWADIRAVGLKAAGY